MNAPPTYYNLPGMDFESTLTLIRQRCPEVPVILVSGAVGEERAIELLRRGVGDFVLKDHLGRLIPAIAHCRREAAEATLRRCEERLRLALDGGDLGIYVGHGVTDHHPSVRSLQVLPTAQVAMVTGPDPWLTLT